MIISPIVLWGEDTLWYEIFLLKDIYRVFVCVYVCIMLSEKQSNTYNL